MPEPTEEEQRVAAHIGQMVDEGLRIGVAGDWTGAVNTMAPLFFQYGPAEAYVWTRAMLRTMQLGCDCGSPARPMVAQFDTRTGRVIPRDLHDSDVPTGVRILAQLMAAHSNDDDATCLALWGAVVENQDTQALTDIMRRALKYAIAAAQQRAAELS